MERVEKIIIQWRKKYAKNFLGHAQTISSKKKTAINNLKKEWSKAFFYLGLPVAGGQFKKSVEGLSMYDKNLPIAGSYTSAGKLRFEADTSPLGVVQPAITTPPT